ncbi:hypothetical protein [Rhodococcus sp. KRD162]|uniref:hypothetical protein n=1 Tax=Rhodococcus sp. KRD162 TaxID=2729725 RepID=UPI0019D042BC|nr:hypothetical protein [Rhodococcus sp. KRD162]
MIALAVLLSGFVSGLLLAQSSGIDLAGGGSIGGLLLSSGGGVLAIAVIAATLLALFVRGRTALAAVSIAAVVAGGMSAVLVPAGVFEYIAVISGGVLLGGSAAVARHSRSSESKSVGLQRALIASFLAGLLTAGAVVALESDTPRRYQDYLLESERTTPIVIPVLALLTAIALAVALGRATADTGAETGTGHSSHAVPGVHVGRIVLAAVLISGCGLLIHWLFLQQLYDGGSDLAGHFYLGVLAIPICVAAAALLPGLGGTMVLAGLAVLAASSTVPAVAVDVSASPIWVSGVIVATAASVAAGAALALRWKHPVAGCSVLALVCATALFDRPPLDNVNYVAGLVAFPAAAVYLYLSCTPAEPSSSTIGLTVPVAITVPMVLTYGWTAYTPLTSIDTSAFSPGVDLWISTGVAFAAVVIAGIGIEALHRRRRPL